MINTLINIFKNIFSNIGKFIGVIIGIIIGIIIIIIKFIYDMIYRIIIMIKVGKFPDNIKQDMQNILDNINQKNSLKKYNKIHYYLYFFNLFKNDHYLKKEAEKILLDSESSFDLDDVYNTIMFIRKYINIIEFEKYTSEEFLNTSIKEIKDFISNSSDFIIMNGNIIYKNITKNTNKKVEKENIDLIIKKIKDVLDNNSDDKNLIVESEE